MAEAIQTVFNMDIATLERMHYIILDANNAARIEDYAFWKRCLEAWERELSPLFPEKKKDEESTEIQKINKKIEDGFEIFLKSNDENLTIQARNNNRIQGLKKAYPALLDKDIYLRKVMKEEGLIFKKNYHAGAAILR